MDRTPENLGQQPHPGMDGKRENFGTAIFSLEFRRFLSPGRATGWADCGGALATAAWVAGY